MFSLPCVCRYFVSPVDVLCLPQNNLIGSDDFIFYTEIRATNGYEGISILKVNTHTTFRGNFVI